MHRLKFTFLQFVVLHNLITIMCTSYIHDPLAIKIMFCTFYMQGIISFLRKVLFHLIILSNSADLNWDVVCEFLWHFGIVVLVRFRFWKIICISISWNMSMTHSYNFKINHYVEALLWVPHRPSLLAPSRLVLTRQENLGEVHLCLLDIQSHTH